MSLTRLGREIEAALRRLFFGGPDGMRVKPRRRGRD